MTRHVIFYLPSLAGGGAEKVVIALLEEIQKMRPDYALSLIVNKGFGPYMEQIPRAVTTHDLGTNNPLLAFHRLSKRIKTLHKNDVLIANLPVPNILASAYNMAFRPKCKIMIVQHNVLSPLIYTNDKKSVKQRCRLWLMQRLYKHSDHIITVSRAVSFDIQHTCHGLRDEQITPIYNPVIDDAFYQKCDIPLNDPWISKQQQNHTPIIVMAARFVAQKDYATLIKAIAQLRDEGINVAACFLGDGPNYAPMKALVEQEQLSEHIHMPGFITNPYPYIKASTMMVHSSAYEGLGLVVLEAMAMRVPVIVSQKPSENAIPSGTDVLRELIGDDHVRGEAFELKNIQDLTNAIKAQLQNPDPMRVDAAYNFAQEFTASNAAKAYLNLIGKS